MCYFFLLCLKIYTKIKIIFNVIENILNFISLFIYFIFFLIKKQTLIKRFFFKLIYLLFSLLFINFKQKNGCDIFLQ